MEPDTTLKTYRAKGNMKAMLGVTPWTRAEYVKVSFTVTAETLREAIITAYKVMGEDGCLLKVEETSE